MADEKTRAIGGLYTVRLTVEGMKHAIEQCLIDHDSSLRASVEAELKAVVARFDFGEAVREAATSVLRTTVTQALDRAVRDAFMDPSVNQQLNDMVREHLRTVLTNKR